MYAKNDIFEPHNQKMIKSIVNPKPNTEVLEVHSKLGRLDIGTKAVLK